VNSFKITPLAYIVVLNWNGKHHLQECLQSLENISYENFKIVLVDNHSTDGSVEFVKSFFPSIEIIRNDRNLGFSAGNNVGIRHALSHGADYVILLNNDTRVEPDFLLRLIQYGETHPDVGVLGGTVRMYGNPNIINSTGVNLNLLAYGWDRDFGMPCSAIQRKAGEVLAVTGALMAVKREVFDQVGLLDPDFFAYFEDVDFCIRVWKYTNFTVEYVPQANVYHKFSASIGRLSANKKRLAMEEQYRLFFKHYPLVIILLLFPVLVLYHLIQNRSDPPAFFHDFFISVRYAIFLPLIVLRRTRWFFQEKKERRGLLWEKVIKEIGLPKIRVQD